MRARKGVEQQYEPAPGREPAVVLDVAGYGCYLSY